MLKLILFNKTLTSTSKCFSLDCIYAIYMKLKRMEIQKHSIYSTYSLNLKTQVILLLEQGHHFGFHFLSLEFSFS